MGNYYVGAPYNFVGINKNVNKREQNQKNLPRHNRYEEERSSGAIYYTMEAQMPIIVDDGNGHFWKNGNGKVAIPGSTVRGLVRSNAQILGMGSLEEDIQDGRLMYRNVATGIYKKQYATILGNGTVSLGKKDEKDITVSVLKNVRAGYIRRTGKKYQILPTCVDRFDGKFGQMNYYVVSERKIIESKYDGFEYLRDTKPYRLQNLDKQFKRDVRGGKVHYKGEKNTAYMPYMMPISYDIKDQRRVTAIDAPGKLHHEGYIISSGRMEEKKAFYVIPKINEKDEENIISITSEDIHDYQRDYEGKKNQLRSLKMDKFLELPKDGETKPVFYIYIDSKLYFGYTPRFRLFYEKQIHDGIPAEHKKAQIDYCQTLFGYTNGKGEKEDRGSYKSRLFFQDAELTVGEEETKCRNLVLSGPKPTSYLDYLNAAKGGGVVSYNDDFVLRGVKQYWLKDGLLQSTGNGNEKTESSFYPYKAGAVFHGVIRFENLTAEEIGFVLWSLILEEDCQQNIGKAKSYGFGRIKVTLDSLKLLDTEALYNLNELCLSPYQDVTEESDQYVKKAKEQLSAFLGRDIMQDKNIQDFFKMKRTIMKAEKTRYMSIQDGDYRERVNNRIKLPSIDDTIKGVEAKTGAAKAESKTLKKGKNESVQIEISCERYKAPEKVVVQDGQIYSATVRSSSKKKKEMVKVELDHDNGEKRDAYAPKIVKSGDKVKVKATSKGYGKYGFEIVG